jgi:hypothetical protein
MTPEQKIIYEQYEAIYDAFILADKKLVALIGIVSNDEKTFNELITIQTSLSKIFGDMNGKRMEFIRKII